MATRAITGRPRSANSVSEECARQLASQFIVHCERSGTLEALASRPAQRDALTTFARDVLGISTRSALTTGDVPLPVQYSGELRELISEFGVARAQHDAVSDWARHGAPGADGHTACIRVDRDVGRVRREIADVDIRVARITQDRRHRAVAARDR